MIGTVIITSMRQRRQLAALVAELAATRAESARLSREAGTAAERERLAREIHDTLAQGFTSIVTLAAGREPRAGNRYRGGEAALELIARHRPGEPRRGAGDRRRADPGPPAVARCPRRSSGSATGSQRDRRRGDRAGAGDLPPLGMATEVVLLRAAQEALLQRPQARAREPRRPSTGLDSPRGPAHGADNGIGFDRRRTSGFGLAGCGPGSRRSAAR